MNRELGLITAEHCYLRKEAGENEQDNHTGIEDEIFSGWAVKVQTGTEKNGWVKITTHYGYEGYIRKNEFRELSEKELKERQNPNRFFRIGIGEADLLSIPKVQGLPLELLLKNAIVELLQSDERGEWSLVRAASGREGYVHTPYLVNRKDRDDYLVSEEETGYFFQVWEKQRENLGESQNQFREKLIQSAKRYLGTQYRWGGKSSQGIDCSGLVFMTYLENGLLIYRDASMPEGYPVRPIQQEELEMGDLLFFKGHVAMYLGDGRYIHSTGHAKTPYVTINSLRPEDADYRQDLIEIIIGYGSVFKK